MQNDKRQTQEPTFPFGGILLVLAGLFMLIQQFVEIELTGGVFLAALGLFFILWGATTRKHGLLIPGGILSGLSLGVFLVEDVPGLIPEYYQSGVILFCLAAGFTLVFVLTQLFTVQKSWWALIVSGGLVLFGLGTIVVESPNAGVLKEMVETTFQYLTYLWPLILVALGIKIIFQKENQDQE